MLSILPTTPLKQNVDNELLFLPILKKVESDKQYFYKATFHPTSFSYIIFTPLYLFSPVPPSLCVFPHAINMYFVALICCVVSFVFLLLTYSFLFHYD